MGERYYVVKEKAVPEVLLKVLEAKRLMEANKRLTVQQAAEQVGISRSSFYKYQDDIFPFTTMLRERPSRLFSRWMMSRGFCRMFSKLSRNITETS